MRKDVLMGGAAVIAALLACKSTESQPNGTPTPSATQFPSAVSPPRIPQHRDVPKMATELAAILRNPEDYATGVDNTGNKTIVFNLRPMGKIAYPVLARYKSDPDAWRFGFDNAKCDDVYYMGLETVELRKGDGRVLSASWYRVKGGPIDGALVKSFPGDEPGRCNIMPGSATYWRLQGDGP